MVIDMLHCLPLQQFFVDTVRPVIILLSVYYLVGGVALMSRGGHNIRNIKIMPSSSTPWQTSKSIMMLN